MRQAMPAKGPFGNPAGILGSLAAWMMAGINAPVYGMAVELLDIQPSDHVLELGFNHARATELAARRATEGFVAGVELSSDMVGLGQRRLRGAVDAGRAEFKVGSTADIPYQDSSFDKVFTVNTIYFWSNPADDLRELRRVLKDGGTLIIAFRGGEPPRGIGLLLGPTLNDAEVEELVGQVKEAGFAQIRVEVRSEESRHPICIIARK